MAQVIRVNSGLLYTKLDEFRRAGKYCDITIRIEETSFKCHRNILAAASEYFDSMFNGNFKESFSDEVALHGDICRTAFGQILRCAYTGEIEIGPDNAYDLLRASDFLKMSNIEEQCINYIQRKVPVRNALEIFLFASATKKEALVNTLSKYIMEHFEHFAGLDKFFEISIDDLCIILKQNAPLRNENILVHTITRWVLCSPEERASYFDVLARTVRFQDLSPSYIEFLLRRYVNDCTTCRRVSESEMSEVDQFQFDISKNKITLHAYVEYVHRRDEDDSLTKAFSLNGCTSRWSSSPSFEIHPGAYFLRNIASNNYQYLYCLDYREKGGQTFRAYSSINEYSTSRRLRPPPIVLPRFSMCILSDRVYVHNTRKDRGIADQNTDIYVYECHLDEWLPVPMSFRVKRATMASDSDRGVVYLIGGPSQNNARMYDPRAPHWQMLPTTTYRYVDAACCSHDEKIYVCGGEIVSKQLEMFDSVAGKWRVMDSMRRGRTSHRLVPFENRLCAMGNSFTDYSIEVYDTLFRKWSTFSLPQDAVDRENPDRRHWESSIIQDVVVYKPFSH